MNNADRLIAETAKQAAAGWAEVSTSMSATHGSVEVNGSAVLTLPLNSAERHALIAFLDHDGFAADDEDAE